MTADDFRKLALGLPGTVESAHCGHPDFRLKGKVIASLGHPNDDFGMVKLTPDDQQAFVSLAPDVFEPCTGAWGERGYTKVRLKRATKKVVAAALETVKENFLPVVPSGAKRTTSKSNLKGKAAPARPVKKETGRVKKARGSSSK